LKKPQAPLAQVDPQGRTILRGPVLADRDLIGVHIVSDSIGAIHQGMLPIRIENSVIEAQICVRTPGHIGLHLVNNTLDCALGVQFGDGALMDNVFLDNRIRGQMSNREL
jgi:hypothetical protein